MGPLAAPAPILKFQLCWELLSSSLLLSPSPFVIMFNPTDTCLGSGGLLIKRERVSRFRGGNDRELWLLEEEGNKEEVLPLRGVTVKEKKRCVCGGN